MIFMLQIVAMHISYHFMVFLLGLHLKRYEIMKILLNSVGFNFYPFPLSVPITCAWDKVFKQKQAMSPTPSPSSVLSFEGHSTTIIVHQKDLLVENVCLPKPVNMLFYCHGG